MTEFVERNLPSVTFATRVIITFQHDGCPVHNAKGVKEYLGNIFLNNWIGRNGPIQWPARSPDFAPYDFFLWRYVK